MIILTKRKITASILTIFTLFITNKFWLINSSFKIEFFIIISVLSFLLFYKLSDYIADFKTFQEKSRLDIFFLIIFFCLLFIPVLHIDNRDKSIEENRMLAVYKPLFRNGKINYSYGKDFEKWFNDRFFTRIFYVKLNNSLRFLLANKNSRGFADKNGFIYYNGELERIDKDKIDVNIDVLNRFNEFCRNNNIKLYVLIVPNREIIYESSDTSKRKNNNAEELFINKIQKLHNINVVYPLNEFKNNLGNEYLFFKTDHHWTDDGAYIGYKVLISEINKNYPNVKYLSADNYNFFYKKQIRADFGRKFNEYGLACRVLGLNDILCRKFSNTNYRYYKHRDFDNLKVSVVSTDNEKTKEYFYNNGYPLKAVLLGTSQSENLCEFLPFTFKNVLRLRTNNVKNTEIMKYYKEKIIDYKPDILILCISYLQFKQLKDMLYDN